jgi:hypothetical protein
VTLALDAHGDVVLEGDDSGAIVRHDLRTGTAVTLDRGGAPDQPALRAILVGDDARPVVVGSDRVARLFGADGSGPVLLFDGVMLRHLDTAHSGLDVLAVTHDGHLLRADATDPTRFRTYALPPRPDPPPIVLAARTRSDGAGVLAALSDASVVVFGPEGSVEAVRTEAVEVGSGPVALLADDVFGRWVSG